MDRRAADSGEVFIFGPLCLSVLDLGRQVDFYTEVLGFRLHELSEERAVLGAGEQPILVLQSGAQRARPRRTTGLFHMAIRFPSRPALGEELRRLRARNAAPEGGADHLVSEAMYLADPEGNGIELYRDRPAAEWPRADGFVVMENAPLDWDGLLAEAAEGDGRAASSSPDGVAEGTRLGHVHLQVADLAAADDFYLGILGFEKSAEFPGQAHFVSLHGYHHHIAYNIWAGRGAPPAPEGSAGLRYFTLRLEEAVRGAVIERAEAAGLPLEALDILESPLTAETFGTGRGGAADVPGTVLTDPSGNRVVLASSGF